MSSLFAYLTVSAILFGIGVYGLMVKRNAIRLLFAIEIVVNAANLNFVSFARFMNPPAPSGQVIAFFSISTAAMEAAVGLALILLAFRLNQTVDVRNLTRLRG